MDYAPPFGGPVIDVTVEGGDKHTIRQGLVQTGMVECARNLLCTTVARVFLQASYNECCQSRSGTNDYAALGECSHRRLR